jgi:hypothetical protein
VKRLLRDEDEYVRLKMSCRERLCAHSYANRLTTIMNTCLPAPPAPFPVLVQRAVDVEHQIGTTFDLPDWNEMGQAVAVESVGVIRLTKPTDDAPGSEQGLSSRRAYDNMELAFDLFLRAETRFIAKVRHVDRANHLSNSYHLYFHRGRAYFARHHHVFREITLKLGQWQALALRCQRGVLSVAIDGHLACQVADFELPRGYAFLGVKGGEALVRNIQLRNLDPKEPDSALPAVPEHSVLYQRNAVDKPRVTVITTVYDRPECLRQCLQSVSRLNFSDYEQIVVSDAPSAAVVDAITEIVRLSSVPRVRYANLARRANNWGIAPALVGLFLSSGHYIAFLSDDNGYAPDHLDALVPALETERRLGFVYSSCLYDGRLVLNHCTPRFGRIDLGQPLFRRELFDLHLNGTLPFKVAAWDWEMVQHFINKGVSYRHVNRPSFIFRLAKYPQFLNA